jgi:hypothetical protein
MGVRLNPMRLVRAMTRPEYLYRPAQLWRRLRRRAVLAHGDVRLAWGLPIEIQTAGYVSVDILNLGVYDRVVPEAICRLLDREWALDVGANVGQNASIMALIAGPHGRVLAFGRIRCYGRSWSATSRAGAAMSWPRSTRCKRR